MGLIPIVGCIARIILDPPCIRCQSVIWGSLNAPPAYHTLFTLCLDSLGNVQVECKPDEAQGDLGLLLHIAEVSMRSLVLHPTSGPANKHVHDGAVRRKMDMHGRIDTFIFSCDSCGHSDVTEMTHRLGSALAARSASPAAASEAEDDWNLVQGLPDLQMARFLLQHFLRAKRHFPPNIFTSSTSFQRLPPEIPLHPRHPLEGLWKGSYGPQGVEVVSVALTGHGPLKLTATKLTGDANVPAGKDTFTVDLGMTIDGDEYPFSDTDFLLPDEYCVHATHKPYNESHGIGFFVNDFIAKATGSGDLYQQGWHEASADKAAAFAKWDAFQRVARRKFGLQSGEHVQWHIGAAVAQRFDMAIAKGAGTALGWHHERLLRESLSHGEAELALGRGAAAEGGQQEKPVALPGLLSAIQQAGGSVKDSAAALAGFEGRQQQGRRMGEDGQQEAPDVPEPRKKWGVAALGWFPHSWESIPNEVVNASEPQPLKAVGEGSGAWTRGIRMGREDRWDELYIGREGDRALHRGERPYSSFQRCNPWRWIHFHNIVVRNKTDRMLHEAEAGRGTEDPRPPAEEGMEGYLGRAKPGTFGGTVASRQGKSEILVIWHAFERPKTCVEDEDVQVPRHNLLYFIRTAVRENDGVDYIFNFGGRVDPDMLELIPPYSNVRVRFIDGGTLHSDTCTFQQTILEQGHAIFHQYKYFFLINNGMRGPFVSASMLTENIHWTQPFTSRLSNETKLVGVTISCEVKTHVQGPFLATDRVGIQYVLDLWGGCWGDHWDEIVHAEIGLTQAIMEDGYNVASMQHEYEGLDFRLEPSKLSCRGKLNPSFCCGMEDPLQLHWIKYGGAVMRIGAQSPYLIRAVENLTDATLALTPALTPSTRWQLPSDDWFEQRDAAQRNVARRNTLWRLSSRLFQRVFSLSRSGNQLAGKQAAASARYLTLLSEDEGHKHFRYQLQPHMSGFESDDTIGPLNSDASEEDLARLEHQTKQPRTTLPSKDSDRELSETSGFTLEASSSNSRSLTEPLVTDAPFRPKR
ncbi:hypothetical protein WJX84_011962 [Apatococcus fuscideae]|uniref:Uncharacterized protein n=1 Tax=Apatococcus fuscideae TaxID=2026836 RepID=A0AAW1T5P0_9CHLO